MDGRKDEWKEGRMNRWMEGRAKLFPSTVLCGVCGGVVWCCGDWVDST